MRLFLSFVFLLACATTLSGQQTTLGKVLAYYDHPQWGKYAAITQNSFGKGVATYIGCMTSNSNLEKILEDASRNAGVWGEAQQLRFPVIMKQGRNAQGKTTRNIFNYSAKPVTINYPFPDRPELIGGEKISKSKPLSLAPWDVKIFE